LLRVFMTECLVDGRNSLDFLLHSVTKDLGYIAKEQQTKVLPFGIALGADGLPYSFHHLDASSRLVPDTAPRCPCSMVHQYLPSSPMDPAVPFQGLKVSKRTWHLQVPGPHTFFLFPLDPSVANSSHKALVGPSRTRCARRLS